MFKCPLPMHNKTHFINYFLLNFAEAQPKATTNNFKARPPMESYLLNTQQQSLCASWEMDCSLLGFYKSKNSAIKCFKCFTGLSKRGLIQACSTQCSHGLSSDMEKVRPAERWHPTTPRVFSFQSHKAPRQCWPIFFPQPPLQTSVCVSRRAKSSDREGRCSTQLASWQHPANIWKGFILRRGTPVIQALSTSWQKQNFTACSNITRP